jgi:glucose/arabinose dehydrogenase
MTPSGETEGDGVRGSRFGDEPTAASRATAPLRGAAATLCAAAAAACASIVACAGAPEEQAPGRLADWSVAEGYSLEIVSEGLELPTSLTPVPAPGRAPSAPRWFVTELRGAIRTIANDGTIARFADLTTFTPEHEWPEDQGEAGLGALCLAPEQGYVFVTYAYRDEEGVLRNGISRFRATPWSFEGPPTERRDYRELLADTRSAFSHQIGSCIVDGDSLYVGVGDGGDPAATRDPAIPLGKILRLTLDGEPHPANPWPKAEARQAAVHAYGLRNPFGLRLVGGRLFGAENGIRLDRLHEIRAHSDHGWDGTDRSIAMNSLAVFIPTIGPAHLAHAAPGSRALAPAPDAVQPHRFVIAASNSQQGPGIVDAHYDWDRRVVLRAPAYIVRFEGDLRRQAVTGVAVMDDGIYFTTIFPTADGGSLLVARYDPESAHTRIIGKSDGDLLAKYNCLGCHSLDGVGGRVGPALDRTAVLHRVSTQVNARSYAELVARLDAIDDPEIARGRAARHEVLEAPERRRVWTWLVNRLVQPSFDHPETKMPELGISRAEAEAIAERLVGGSLHSRIIKFASNRFFAGGAVVGAAAASGLFLAAAVLLWWRRRRGSDG